MSGSVTRAVTYARIVSLLLANGLTLTSTAAAGPAGLQWAAPATAVTYNQAQSTTGVGATTLLRAQRGFAGSVGGTLQLGGGDGGTLGTNQGGPTQVLLGTPDASSVSAKFQLVTGPIGSLTSILDVSQTSATGLMLTSPLNILSLNAGTTLNFNIGGSSTPLQVNSGGLVLSGTSVTWTPTVSAPSITQTQNGSAAGNTFLFRAQRGAAGFIGGTLQIGGGDGGTLGTNLGGPTQVLLGSLNASSASAKFSLVTGLAGAPASILDASQTGASTTTIASSNAIVLNGVTSLTGQIGGTPCFFFAASQTIFRISSVIALTITAGSFVYNDSGGATGLTVLPSSSGAGAMNWAAGATAVNYGQTAIASGTGAVTTITGQNTGSGTGGQVNITGGSGTTAPGAVQLGSGATPIATFGGNAGMKFAQSTVAFTNTNVTLTPAQSQTPNIACTGTLTGNVRLIFPSAPGIYFVDLTGLTLGAFTFTVQAGTGFTQVFAVAGQFLFVVKTDVNLVCYA